MDTKEIFKVIIKANSSKNEILGFDEERKAYRVAIKEKAEKNKANIEILKFFRKKLGKEVKIIKGIRNKEKVLKVVS